MILALAAATATIATTVEALAAGVTTAVAIYGIAKTGKAEITGRKNRISPVLFLSKIHGQRNTAPFLPDIRRKTLSVGKRTKRKPKRKTKT